MRSRYRPLKNNMKADWAPIVGVLGALGVLLVSVASYFTNQWDAREQAELQAYLSSGINPPR